jgi:hypothetical protein
LFELKPALLASTVKIVHHKTRRGEDIITKVDEELSRIEPVWYKIAPVEYVDADAIKGLI